MERLNFCHHAGYLVGPGRTIPDEPCEYHLDGAAVTVGCTRLRCEQCGEWVVADRDPLPPDQYWRGYECGCTRYEQEGILRSADDDDAEDPWIPWRCAGHPVSALPLLLDGVTIDLPVDLVALVRRSLAGWSPEAARPAEREMPDGWVTKLHARLAGGPLDGQVGRAVAACLLDEEPRVRATGLRFLARQPWVPCAERVEELVGGDRRPFALPDPLAPHSLLDDRLLGALGRRLICLEREGEAFEHRRALARAEVLRPGRGPVLFHFLAEVDHPWLVEQAEAIVLVDPSRSRPLLEAVATGAAGPLGARIARMPGVDREWLARFAERIGEPGRSEILAGLAAGVTVG